MKCVSLLGPEEKPEVSPAVTTQRPDTTTVFQQTEGTIFLQGNGLDIDTRSEDNSFDWLPTPLESRLCSGHGPKQLQRFSYGEQTWIEQDFWHYLKVLILRWPPSQVEIRGWKNAGHRDLTTLRSWKINSSCGEGSLWVRKVQEGQAFVTDVLQMRLPQWMGWLYSALRTRASLGRSRPVNLVGQPLTAAQQASKPHRTPTSTKLVYHLMA